MADPESHYEVIKVGPEWCLRIRASGRPVAWSKRDDAPWQAYCEEAERDAMDYRDDY